jgi:glucose/arabinose dehydrogenase
MSKELRKIDTFLGHVEFIDTFSEYVDFWAVFRQIGSIGRCDRHKREPRAGMAIRCPYALVIDFGGDAMGNTRFSWFVPALALVLAACGGSSGGGSPMVPPPPPPPAPPPPAATPTIDVAHVFPQLSFVQPLLLVQAPIDSTQWYVAERRGLIHRFANDQSANSSTVFLDITDRVDAGPGEAGLLGVAFHPSYPAVPEVYVSYTRTGGPLVSYVSRFTTVDGGLTLDATTEEVILTVLQDFGNHNGGNILFGPDDDLYIGFGDGGSGGDPNNRAQTTTNLLGAILRIDVSGAPPYNIPADNPFAVNSLSPCVQGFGGADCPEIFAWGLRNPWRFSFDRQTDALWVGDVGQGNWEEVDRVANGDNLGWREREGAHCFDPSSGCATTFVDPITEYDHSLGVSITGGFVYRGAAIPDLIGWYVFGDFGSGRIFAVPADSPTGTAPAELLGSGLSIASFAESNDGEIYIVDYGGSIRQITDAP